jgi:hypothetical protein
MLCALAITGDKRQITTAVYFVLALMLHLLVRMAKDIPLLFQRKTYRAHNK